jgi:elongation factor G
MSYAQAAEMRDRMVEQIAETDDALTLKYLEGQEISVEDQRSVAPGSDREYGDCGLLWRSLRNKGVQSLLDAVIDYLPSPADVPPVRGYHPSTEAEERRARIVSHSAGLSLKS